MFCGGLLVATPRKRLGILLLTRINIDGSRCLIQFALDVEASTVAQASRSLVLAGPNYGVVFFV